MLRRIATHLGLASIMIAFGGQDAAIGEDAIDKAQLEKLEFFEAKIRPVLIQHCYECHSSESKTLQGGLLLDSKQGLLKGGDSGPAIDPSAPDESLLLSALRYEDFEMPPKGKLPQETIADIEAWIAQGAVDPRNLEPKPISADSSIDVEAAKSEWTYRPPQKQTLPAVNSIDWVHNRIDFFVLKQLEEAHLQPSAQADRRTTIRRLSYDLTGLPPTATEVDRFKLDDSVSAYEQLVDKLISSPQFGVRWARMWLDIARYAEDQAHIVGDDKSLLYPNAYLYRDWVIDAFNSDLSYDDFVSLQLAADVLRPADTSSHIALGFLGLGPKYYDRGRLEVKADEWEDRVDVVGRGLLGLTLACARCHDHKYDPISTHDYYALAGVFASTEMFNRPRGDAKTDKKGQAENPDESIHIVREGKATDLNVFVRGNVEQKGDLAKRRMPLVLCSVEPTEIKSGSGRVELAQEIATSKNPLTARVFVNRVFGELTGHPIVATPSNFGKLGQRPTHPRLLDDLAARFMENGWSIKWLVREIVMSATYRQSSNLNEELWASDPGNRLLGRMNRRKMTVEQFRDSVLSVSSNIDLRVGGPSIEIHDSNQRRRTAYSFVSRFQLDPMLVLFDFPDANVHAAARAETTTPLQKLFVMNNDFMTAAAKRISRRLSTEPNIDGEVIISMYRTVLGRLPSEAERDLALVFARDCGPNTDGSLSHLAHALLASNEMLFID